MSAPRPAARAAPRRPRPGSALLTLRVAAEAGVLVGQGDLHGLAYAGQGGRQSLAEQGRHTRARLQALAAEHPGGLADRQLRLLQRKLQARRARRLLQCPPPRSSSWAPRRRAPRTRAIRRRSGRGSPAQDDDGGGGGDGDGDGRDGGGHRSGWWR